MFSINIQICGHSRRCPFRDKSNGNMADLIKMQSDILLVDKDGNPIEVKAIQPEYISDIFS